MRKSKKKSGMIGVPGSNVDESSDWTTLTCVPELYRRALRRYS